MISGRNYKELRELFSHFRVKHRSLRSTLTWQCSSLRIKEMGLTMLATMNRAFMFAKHKNVCEKLLTIRWQDMKSRSSKRPLSGLSLTSKISKTTKSKSKRYLHQLKANKILRDNCRRKKRRWFLSRRSSLRTVGENKSDLSHKC